MNNPLNAEASALTPKLAAPQHGPRPLPLFLEMLRRETAGQPDRMATALRGLRAYQEAPRGPARELMPAVAERLGAKLRDYGGNGPPVLFVPSLINPPNILDLDEDRSLLRWLAGEGHHVLLLDWGWDVDARRSLSVAGHIEQILLPLIREVGEPPALVGYCLGGTMAMAAAQLSTVRSLATIAAPWHFSGYPNEARTMLADLWRRSQQTASRMGILPMEVLQSAFWSLDPARTVHKFEAFAAMDPASREARRFIALEDWANDGPPISHSSARELFEDFFSLDAPGRGAWIVGGQPIAPAKLACPLLNVVSTTDRIVPQGSATTTGEPFELHQGHVGMVVGRKARGSLWEALALWLSGSLPRSVAEL